MLRRYNDVAPRGKASHILVCSMLAAAFFVRYMLDGGGHAQVSAVPVFGVLVLLVALNGRLITPRRFGLFAATATGVLVASYFVVLSRYGEWVYQMKPIIRYLTYFAVFLAIYNSRISARWLFRLFTILMFIQAAVAVFQFFVLNQSRPAGTLVNNNHLMYLAALYFAVSLVYFGSLVRAAFGLFLGLLLGGIGGLLAMVFVFVHYAVITKRSIFLKTLVASGLLLATLLSSQFDRISDILMGDTVEQIRSNVETGKLTGAGSFGWRIVTWSLYVDRVHAEGAMLTGLGVDASSNVSPYFLDVGQGKDPHNDFVRMYVDYGAVVTGTYVALLVWLITTFSSRYARTTDRRYSAAATIFVVLATSHLAGNTLTQSTLMWFVFGFLAVFFRQRGDVQIVSGPHRPRTSI